MIRILKIAVLVLAIQGSARLIFAQGLEWEKLQEEIKVLKNEKKFDQALVLGKKALEFAEKAKSRIRWHWPGVC